MSENRFADCTTVEAVLWKYHELARDGYGSTALTAPASARIRELTPPVVSEEARERARAEARKWWDEPCGHDPSSYNHPDALADRIIDALGYTPAPECQTTRTRCASCDGTWNVSWSKDHDAWFCGYCWKREVDTHTPAFPPVVELDADELQSLASLARWYAKALRGFDELVVKIDPIEAVIVRTGYDTVRVRIGGGDE